MAGETTIEWTEYSLNYHNGCRRVSPGCVNCYAEIFAARFGRLAHFVGPEGKRDARWTGEWTRSPEVLEELAGWERQTENNRLVFVNSMSDFFFEPIPLEDQQMLLERFAQHPRLLFQILTKRSERLAERAADLPWADNVAMGVSVESSDYLGRIDHLRGVPARWRFLSLEPLLSALPGMDLSGIHWVIVGGESGHNVTPCDLNWIKRIVCQCDEQGVPVFVKQIGTYPRHYDNPWFAQGLAKRRKGGDMTDWPAEIKRREFPPEWQRYLAA